jgi:hypothetical protein
VGKICFRAPDEKGPVTNRGVQIILGCLGNDVTRLTRMYGQLANLRRTCVKGWMRVQNLILLLDRS